MKLAFIQFPLRKARFWPEVSIIKQNQRAKLKINKETAKSNKQKLKSKMPIVSCTCGTKILVVPDIAAMNKAVKNHKAKHKGADDQLLTEQILKVASEQVIP